jgi:hypothetical protein
MVMLSAASADMIYAVDDVTRALVAVDPDALVVSTLGSLGVATGWFGDLAYEEASGTLWWAAGRSNNRLYTVNLATGAATLVGSHGIDDLFALGYDGVTLYGQATSGSVYRIDKDTGAATLLGSNTVYPGGYDWNPDTGQMILLEASQGYVYSVNLADGFASPLSSVSLWTNDNDIAYDADRNVYWAADYSGYLYRYDASWNRTELLTGFPAIAALEYVPDATVIPAPSALFLAGAGLLTGLVGQRSKHAA